MHWSDMKLYMRANCMWITAAGHPDWKTANDTPLGEQILMLYPEASLGAISWEVDPNKVAAGDPFCVNASLIPDELAFVFVNAKGEVQKLPFLPGTK
jgi:hypothetical protein